MPVLRPTQITGTVVWLGLVKDRAAQLESVAVEALTASFAGLVGESHSGLTRPSCSRVVSQYPKGTIIRNTRQIAITSLEETEQIAADLGLDVLKPEWLGSNIVIAGIPDFTLIPPSSRLVFANGTSLTVDMENAPCHLPARVIEAARPGHGAAFKTTAKHRRGVTGWVEAEGEIALGQKVTLHTPPQRLYPHL